MTSGQMTDMVFLQQRVFVKPEEEENEHLRIGLLNAQTEVTLIQTQLDKLKQEFMAEMATSSALDQSVSPPESDFMGLQSNCGMVQSTRSCVIPGSLMPTQRRILSVKSGFSDSELELEPLSCENVDKSDGKGPQESDQDTTGGPLCEQGKNGSLYHLVLAGDVGSGKSSFLLHLSQHKFKDDMRSTVGVDCEIKHMLVDGKRMVLQIWDTAGQERFRSISRSYFRKAHGILLLYDITSKKSFSNITQWLEQIEVCTDKSVPMCLVGNKADLREDVPEEQCVSWACGMRLAKACGALFLETSAKDGTNVVEAVLHLAREVKKGGGALTDSTLQLSSVRDQDPAAGKCCWALS